MWNDPSLNSYFDPSNSSSSSGSYYDPSIYDSSWMNDPSMWSGTNYSGGSSSGSSSYWDPSSVSIPSAPPASTYSPSPDYSSYGSPLDYTNQNAGNPSTQMYNYYMNSAGGNVGQAFNNVAADRWTGGAANSIPTRNAEHALFSQYMVNSNPVIGPIGAAVLPPIYNAAKWAAQNVPAIGHITDAILPKSMSLTGATPPSWESLLWGWKPFWPQSYQVVR